MYLEHYGLAEAPFSITPDPRFVFLGERHRDALAHLLFGIGQGGGGGFVQLTGEVGTGKTTLSRLLLEQLPADTRVALLLNPRQSPVELLRTVCEELGIAVPAADRDSSKALVDALNAYLLRAHADGLRVVLLIDEAQDLSVDALEQVRLLTNLETDRQKLLQVVLLGQPELRDLLARQDLRQLAQRITARFHLTPLEAAETGDYLRHRYRVAGGTRFPFAPRAVRRIHAHAGGVPRLVNVIAERALLAGYAHDLATIDARTVDRAAREVLPAASAHRRWPVLAAAGTVAALAVVVLLWPRTAEPPVAAAIAAPTGNGSAEPATPPPAATPVVPAIAAPALPDADALARHVAAHADDAAGWIDLWRAWDVQAPPVERIPDACRPVMAPGLYCVAGSGRLDKLQTFARPALLALDAGSATHWVLLLGVDTDRVLLRIGEAPALASRQALDVLWNGAFVTAWSGPAFLAPMVSGSDVPDDASRAWLADHLGTDPAIDPGPALRRFQSARGLLADGIAGPETVLALAAGDPGPRLDRTVGEDR